MTHAQLDRTTPPTPPGPASQCRRPHTLLVAAALWLGGFTGAQAAPATTAVEAVQLPAWVERGQQRRPAEPGQLLREGDKAITAGQARMLLRMTDSSIIKLGEQTQLQIEAMSSTAATAGEARNIRSTLRLITGVFRYATHYTSKALGSQRNIDLKLATATVGIRGTDFWSMTDAEHDAVCLFDGAVEVLRPGVPGVALAQPGAFWVVFTGQPEKPAGQATPEQLAKFIGQAEMQPGSGVLLQGGRWRAVVGSYSSAGSAAALRERLAAAGYPGQIVVRQGQHEVRINQLATRTDAEVVLARLQAQASLGVSGGRVALAAD